jgi:RNA polymerase sigma-70 factor (ECF subfamily)
MNCSSQAARDPAVDAAFGKDLVQQMSYLDAFSFSLCRDRELARELAQEALCHAWKARSSFRPGTNMRAWLFRILRNLLHSHHRRSWRQVNYDDNAVAQIPGPERPQEWAMVASDTVRVLHVLPRDQRQALMLVGLAGFAHGHAARLINCSEGTMKSRVSRGRKAARAALDSLVPLAAPRPPIGQAGYEITRELEIAMRVADAVTHAPGIPGGISTHLAR